MPHPPDAPKCDQSTSGRVNFLNIPNSISIFRIIGSLGLVLLAISGVPIWFVALYVLLGITDLIDGPLARWLGQQTPTGASLDSLADILLSLGLLAGATILCWNVIVGELWLIGLALFSYLMAFSVSLLRFGKIPALHTIAAKINHFLVAIAGILLVLQFSVWPFRVAAITTVLTNLELVAILVSLPKWRTDVRSFFLLGRVKEKEHPQDS